jgi:hypothetical protein
LFSLELPECSDNAFALRSVMENIRFKTNVMALNSGANPTCQQNQSLFAHDGREQVLKVSLK